MADHTTTTIEALRQEWTELYSETLPLLARARDPAQSRWPVTLDHCFARIILDNTIGRGTLQWDNVINRPAIRNMDAAQLKEAIELGGKIKVGKANLVELDQQSLRARGRSEKKHNLKEADIKNVACFKHARDDQEDNDNNNNEKQTQPIRPTKQRKRTPNLNPKTQTTLTFTRPLPPSCSSPSPSATPNPNLPTLLTKISTHPTLTPFRKRLYSTLLSVPPGHYTTYAQMAHYLFSSPRAVGNGMRNNPFAPDVPCHRVLAADGSIGGFGGEWGVEGKYAVEKRGLLVGEGVKFDSRGKVRGGVFGGLRDMREVEEG